MKSNIFTTFVFTVLLIISVCTTAAEKERDPHNWKHLAYEQYNIYYQEGSRKIAEDALLGYKGVEKHHSDFFSWQIQDYHIVLSDRTDNPNGFSTPLPYNLNGFGLTPGVNGGSLVIGLSWIDALIIHEGAHAYHLDAHFEYSVIPEYIFGRTIFSMPSAFLPTFITEGIATYLESDPVKKTGRGTNGYFDGIMRYEYAKSYRSLGNTIYNSKNHPKGVNYYYGYNFFEFMEAKFGKDGIKKFLKEHGSSLLYGRINASLKRALNVDFDEVWPQYQQYLENKFRNQLQEISKLSEANSNSNKVIKKFRIADGAAGDLDVSVIEGKLLPKAINVRHLTRPKFIDNNTIAWLQDDGNSKQKLVQQNIDSKKITTITSDLLTPVLEFDYHEKYGFAIAKPSGLCNYEGFNMNLFFDVFLVDKKGNERRLTNCARYKQITWHPNGEIFAISYVRGKSYIDILDRNGNKKDSLLLDQVTNKMITAGYLDINSDGSKLAISLKDGNKGWDVYEYNFSDKKLTRLTKAHGLVAGISYDASSNFIYYTANYNQHINVYRINTTSKKIDLMTNVVSIAYNPSTSSDGSKLAYGLLGKEGYQVAIAENIAVKTIATPTGHGNQQQYATFIDSVKYRNSILKDSTISDYSPLPTLVPRNWFTNINSSPLYSTLGIMVSGTDALQYHQISTSINYTTGSKEWVPSGFTGYLTYQYADFFSFSGSHTKLGLNDFSYREEDAAVLNFSWLLYSNVAKMAGLNIGASYRKNTTNAISAQDKEYAELTEKNKNDIPDPTDDKSNFTGALLTYNEYYPYYYYDGATALGFSLSAKIDQHHNTEKITYDKNDGTIKNKNQTYENGAQEFNFEFNMPLFAGIVATLGASKIKADDKAKPYTVGGFALDRNANRNKKIALTSYGNRAFPLAGYASSFQNVRELNYAKLFLYSPIWQINNGYYNIGIYSMNINIGIENVDIVNADNAFVVKDRSQNDTTYKSYDNPNLISATLKINFNIGLLYALRWGTGLFCSSGETSKGGVASCGLYIDNNSF